MRLVQAAKRERADISEEEEESVSEERSDSEDSGEDNEEDVEMEDSTAISSDIETAKRILDLNIVSICDGLFLFWQRHSTKLKQALLGSRQR